MSIDTGTLLRESVRGRESADSIAGLVMAGFVGSFVAVVPPMYFPQIAARFDVEPESLGLLATVAFIVSTIAALVTGPLADKRGFRALLVTGSAAAGVYLLAFAIVPHYVLLIPLAVMGGIACAILPNISAAAAASISRPETRKRAIGWASASAALAVVAGVPVLSVLTHVAGWPAAFTLAALLTAVVTLFLYARIPARKETVGSGSPLDGFQQLLQHDSTRRLLISNIFRAMPWIAMVTYMGAYFGSHHDMGPGAISMVYTATGLTYLIGSLVARHVMTRISAKSIVTASNLIIGVLVLVIFTIADSFALAVFISGLSGMFGGVSWVAVLTLLGEESPASQSITMTVSGMLINGASAIGVALSGAILAAGSYGHMAVFLLVPTVLSAVVIYWPQGLPLRSIRRQCTAGQLLLSSDPDASAMASATSC